MTHLVMVAILVTLAALPLLLIFNIILLPVEMPWIIGLEKIIEVLVLAVLCIAGVSYLWTRR